MRAAPISEPRKFQIVLATRFYRCILASARGDRERKEPNMKSSKEIAEQTGTDIELVRRAMWDAHQTYEGKWHVGNAGTGVIGAGDTRQEAVIYALEHNAQFIKVL